jgi:hypothetical protein
LRTSQPQLAPNISSDLDDCLQTKPGHEGCARVRTTATEQVPGDLKRIRAANVRRGQYSGFPDSRRAGRRARLAAGRQLMALARLNTCNNSADARAGDAPSPPPLIPGREPFIFAASARIYSTHSTLAVPRTPALYCSRRAAVRPGDAWGLKVARAAFISSRASHLARAANESRRQVARSR